METVSDFIFGAPKSLQMVTAARKLEDACSWKKRYDKPRQSIKKQRHRFAKKVCRVKVMTFSVVMYMDVRDHEEDWAPKNWCFQTVVLEKTLESPLGCKEIKPVRPKGNQSWIFIVRTDAKAEFQYFGHLMWRTNSLEKTLMLRKIEGKRRGATEEEMVRLHHWLNGHKFEQTLGDNEGQGSLVCCSRWGSQRVR